MVCRSDGSIYFTNPGLRPTPEQREIDFHRIHRIAPDGTVTAVITDLESPIGQRSVNPSALGVGQPTSLYWGATCSLIL